MTLNIGMVGTGWFSRRHAELLAGFDGVRIAAVCGSTKEKADHMARDFNAVGFASIHEMVDQAALDAAYICVPPFAHGEIERKLIERGIPFFIEKPIGTDLEVPSEILEAIRKTNLLTSVGYHFRYFEGTARAKTLLASRSVGMALGYWSGSMPGVYWWRNLAQSGGQFVEQTTHIVDLLRYLLGEVVEVYAIFGHQVMHERSDGVTVPDVGTVSLKLESGVIANISNTCVLPAGHWQGLYVHTDVGTLEITRDFLVDIQAGETTTFRNRIDPYEIENRAFIHAVRTGDHSGILSTYSDAWRTQQVTVAANQSAATGQPVRLPQ